MTRDDAVDESYGEIIWTKVSDKLPEYGQQVLTYSKFNGMDVDYLLDIVDTEVPYFWSKVLVDEYYTVTHWMPVPKKPKEK